MAPVVLLMLQFRWQVMNQEKHVRRRSCRLTIKRRVWHMEQELFILPEHLSSPPGYCEVRVAQSARHCVGFCRYWFNRFVRFPLATVLSSHSTIHDFWWPFWYFQTFPYYEKRNISVVINEWNSGVLQISNRKISWFYSFLC